MPKENDNRRVTRSQKKAADSTTSDSNDEKSKSPKAKAGGELLCFNYQMSYFNVLHLTQRQES